MWPVTVPLIRACAAILAGLLGGGALAAAVLAQAGRFSPWFDVLAHFAPLYLAAGLASVALSFAAQPQHRVGLLALGALAVVAAGLLMAGELRLRLSARPKPADGDTLTVVQFNAWGGNRQPDAAAAWILAQDPDVVVLQEGARVASRLRRAGLVGRDCLDCGIMILTRRLPVSVFMAPPEQGVRSFLGSVTLRDGQGDFEVVGIHRYWPVRREKAGAQTAALQRLLAGHSPRRTILAGDFNSTPWSFERRREDEGFGLVRRTLALPTWPAGRLSHNRLPAPFAYMPIDHVYAGPGWRTVSVRRGPRLGSDHYPVVVTLQAVPAGPT